MLKKLTQYVLAPAITLALLAGMTVERWSRPGPQNAEPYHQRVAAAMGEIDYRIGEWFGTDVPIPREAEQLLRPNALLSRQYEHFSTGHTVHMLVVQCADARDLRGHYPPRCYPSHGWRMLSQEARYWRFDDGGIPGREYRFTFNAYGETPQKIVHNFMVLPDGRVVPDIDAVADAASDYLRYFYGAAQVQLVYMPGMDAKARDEAFRTLVGGILPAIEVIREGEKR